MDGADYEPKARESFNLVACIGASWIYGGHRGTLKALNEMAAPGGWVIVGEPYWQREPTAEYLEAIGQKRNAYGTHYENMKVGQEFGLKLVYTLVSNQDDWDRYEALQWYAADEWASKNPDDPDVGEVLKRVREDRENGSSGKCRDTLMDKIQTELEVNIVSEPISLSFEHLDFIVESFQGTS